ncbi:MFS multidrug transporter [Coniophora puteana RWD-64-598 SS2]|uniref:MFS multidrug transporter n=1 Tax=Coniophora puteana (strain RWD-64-598) TaxID=741705 RepID=A0A5M3MNP1_CONPW|nr:MFS multidrug transporter [Coniophora puteana RWD-64-598 SS2]EIW80646.1 MFS multidrug transporter [Coniophora puteana RWD-64-598 SS2]
MIEHRESISSTTSPKREALREAGEDEKVHAIERARREGKVVLTEDDCYDALGYNFGWWKKWTILTVIFIVQVSMNFNSSLYSNNLDNIQEKFGVSAQAARCGAMIFLVFYAFGCELWAPWSEELGRKPILQLSLFLVNLWQIPAALSPTFGGLLVARALGGLSSAGGSVTLGMVADMFEPNDQQYAVAYIVLSSVGGSIFGPIIGAFTEAYLGYKWNFWVQLIFGLFTQVCHLLLVPETRSSILVDREAKRRRKNGEPNVYGPNEVTPVRERFSAKEIGIIWIRPFHMFLTEPIVLFLSLLSGFSDALIFMFLQSFALVYKNIYGFGTIATNMAFAPILIGYFIAWFSFMPFFNRNKRDRELHPHNERIQYESRLWWLLFTAPCLWIGLFGFAWTTLPNVHWIASMIFAAVIGIANYSIYMATIDYMICAYGAYSASATGGNGFSRDFLAGVLTIPATPFFTNIGPDHHVNYACTILGCIAFLITIPVYIFYFKGEWFRKRSPFACSLADAAKENELRRTESIVRVSTRHSEVRGTSLRSPSRARSRKESVEHVENA